MMTPAMIALQYTAASGQRYRRKIDSWMIGYEDAGHSIPYVLMDQKIYSMNLLHRQGDTMKAFRATGSFTISKQNYMSREQPFKIEVAANDEADASHKIISTIGSRHRVNRNQVTVSEIVMIKNDEVTDLVVKHLIGGA
jgi:large subunit ribosomal protein LX